MSLCLPLSEGAIKWQEQTIRQLEPRIHCDNKRKHNLRVQKPFNPPFNESSGVEWDYEAWRRLCPGGGIVLYPLYYPKAGFVASPIAGLSHYVLILNLEDAHSPVDESVHQVNPNWLERISYPPR